MKFIALFIVFVLTAQLISAEAIGKVSFFIGNAKVKSAVSQSWQNAKINLPVGRGDQIKTEKSDRLEIMLKDGSLVRVAEESEITLAFSGEKKISTSVQKGKIWANIKKLGQRNYDFEVTSSTATAAIRGTIFTMDELDSNTVVSVYDGKVAVGPGSELKKSLPEGGAKMERKEVPGPSEIPGPFEVSLMDWVTIAKGQRISVMKNGKYAQTKIDSKKEANDEWVKFNISRDSVSGISHGN